MAHLEFIKPTYSAVKSVNGMTGDVIIEIPEADVDLTGYATEEYVAKKIAEAELSEGEVDLSAYYTKSETDKKIEDAVAAIDVPEVDVDLTGYATEQFVNDAISTIELTPGPKGEDGYTPVKGVDYFDGKDGEPGKDGADGNDYVLTDEDKQEIAGMVEVSGSSVEVDNETIVQDEDGVISTVIGGAVVNTESFNAFSWNGTHGVNEVLNITSASINAVEDLLTGSTVNITIIDSNGNEYVSEEASVENEDGVVVIGDVAIEGGFIDEITFEEEELSFALTDEATGTEIITSINIVANSSKVYEPINGNFIPLGKGLGLDGANAIQIKETYINKLIGNYMSDNYPSGEEVSY